MLSSRFSENIKLRYMVIVGVFLLLYSIALTLSPAVRARSWDVDFRWGHWLGFFTWLAGFSLVFVRVKRYLPNSDPIILPVVALLSGWGVLSIWRLTPTFGLRQTLWLSICLAVVALGVRLPSDLVFLRKYKYLWLTGGLVLTALTLIFGTNPLGYGPRLWLGCCGLYLQPSEPLKLLLIIYLAAYLADWSGYINLASVPSQAHEGTKQLRKNRLWSHLPNISFLRIHHLQILVPTLLMTGLAILILLVQRDLGTASILIFLYSVLIFLATGWYWIPVVNSLILIGVGFLGYLFFDVIRLRVDAWINPWVDPAGRSYQIVQSLMAIANGGLIGRGPGLGNPSLVPVAHSDFIFSAIAEEGGLLAVVAMLALLGLLAFLGITIANTSVNKFRKFLAGGLTAFLVAQSILIIGGNLRMLPLTGVTLPFVSYGGSSLLVSFLVLTLFLHLSVESGDHPEESDGVSELKTSKSHFKTLSQLSIFLFIGLFMTSLVTGWWVLIRNNDLLSRTDNPRRSISDRYVKRGTILDRLGNPIVETVGISGDYERYVYYPSLGPIIGYSHPVYGQSGLEASLDPILRGMEGNNPMEIWWHHLVYGQPPPGLDIRITIDLDLQSRVDELMAGQIGGLILLNAETGEILVMASHPYYDPNQLDEVWETLLQEPKSPLLNRVVQGSYPTGNLSTLLDLENLEEGTNINDSLRLPMVSTNFPAESTILELALAASALSNGGIQMSPKIAQLMRNPDGGWLIMSPLDSALERYQPDEVVDLVNNLSLPGSLTWQILHIPQGESLTWYVSGTTSRWEGLPLTLALVLEMDNAALTEEIGQSILAGIMAP